MPKKAPFVNPITFFRQVDHLYSRRMSSIAILGAGAMGSAIAKHVEHLGHRICLFDIDESVIKNINEKHENPTYLPKITFAKNIRATTNIEEAIQGAEIVFIVIPSVFIKSTLKKIAPHLSKRTVLVNISKGLDPLRLLPPVLQAPLAKEIKQRICIVGGPAIAQDLATGSPTGLVVASADEQSAKTIQKLLQTKKAKVAISKDIKGVGVSAALKNVYAIALGMCDGMSLPTNAKAMILTIALQEMRALLKASGGKEETAFGLAGVGDLIVTGFSTHGRNRSYGELLVKATTKDPKALGLTTVEGLDAVDIATKIMQTKKINAPLLTAIAKCLHASKDYACPFENFLDRFTF